MLVNESTWEKEHTYLQAVLSWRVPTEEREAEAGSGHRKSVRVTKSNQNEVKYHVKPKLIFTLKKSPVSRLQICNWLRVQSFVACQLQNTSIKVCTCPSLHTLTFNMPTVRPAVCFPVCLLLIQFMCCSYPHQITALLDPICSHSYCGAFLQKDSVKILYIKKKKANIYSWANAFPNLYDGPHCVWGDGLQWACWFLSMRAVAHLVRKNGILPSHSVCSGDHTLGAAANPLK